MDFNLITEIINTKIKYYKDFNEEAYTFIIKIKDINYTIHKKSLWNIIPSIELKNYLYEKFPYFCFDYKKTKISGYFDIIVTY